MDIIKFTYNIICYWIANILSIRKRKKKALSASLNKIEKSFALKLYKKNNTIILKI